MLMAGRVSVLQAFGRPTLTEFTAEMHDVNLNSTRINPPELDSRMICASELKPPEALDCKIMLMPGHSHFEQCNTDIVSSLASTTKPLLSHRFLAHYRLEIV